MPTEIPVYVAGSEPLPLYQLVTASGMAPSNSEARRLMEGGGVKVDGEAKTDRDFVLEPKDGMVVQVGKRKFVRLEIK